ncbi:MULTISPECIES: hypothetical protein [unclassified Streptomyces]|uniref:hypothetical protein n=1 Tax=unclassified Streptomyces TaxID=2593676 RepID=UPI00093D2026|nr:hypothetical protein [Streptomyces sp. TSRI0107]OKJ71153.1 hypothetical protein AMK31_35370 [Streptomyces sp. TSRI0107]
MSRFSGDNNKMLRIWLSASFVFALFLVWLIFFQKMYGAWVGLAILALFWVLAFWVTKPSNSR